MPEVKKWRGTAIKNCDLCKSPITDQFVDGMTVYGPWAIMCMSCHKDKGHGIKTGLEQHYKLQPDGVWLKVGG